MDTELSERRFDELAKRHNLVPVFRRISADLDTPVGVFLKLRRARKNCFLLESVERGVQVARYSFIGVNPKKVLRLNDGDPLAALQKEFAGIKYAELPDLPAFSGGAVGYLAYDTIRYFEPKVPPISDEPTGMEVPEAIFMFMDEVVAFDHVRQEMVLIVNTPTDNNAAYRIAHHRLDELEKSLRADIGSDVTLYTLKTNAQDEMPSKGEGGYDFAIGFDEYKKCVEECIAQIHRGELIQVVFSQRLTRRITQSPFEFYRALRRINPSPYMFYLDFEDFQIVGASPERLVAVNDGLVSVHPIAGTRPRGKNREEDARLAKDLLADPKERAEHLMLLDLGRNDVGRVARPGTVRITRDTELEYYSSVIHIVSNVVGELNEGVSPLDALRAGFPAGTVSGAPKVRAMQLIAELERIKRGPYAGAIGYFGYNGDLDTCIALRTMVLKDGVATIQAGGGIVADSVVEREYKETLQKLGALTAAIEEVEQRGVTAD